MDTLPETATRKQDKDYYSGSLHYFTDEHIGAMREHVQIVSEYIDAIRPRLDEKLRKRPDANVIELGAGTCLTSLLLRRQYPQIRLTCVDISLVRMQELIAKTARLVETSAEGIDLREGDFTYALPFEDAHFDLVVFDGALHHSRNIWKTLEECRRVLRPDGAVAALREAYLAPLTYRFALSRLFQSEEVQNGVAENAYLKEQYDYYFRATGFEPKFVPVNPNWTWRLAKPLNGIAFSKWSIWARPTA